MSEMYVGVLNEPLIDLTEPAPQPEVTAQISISPQESTVRRGDSFRLTCKVEMVGSGDRSTLAIVWSKMEGPLPASGVASGPVFTLDSASPADSGVYICTVTSTVTGVVIQQTQSRVNVLAFR